MRPFVAHKDQAKHAPIIISFLPKALISELRTDCVRGKRPHRKFKSLAEVPQFPAIEASGLPREKDNTLRINLLLLQGNYNVVAHENVWQVVMIFACIYKSHIEKAYSTRSYFKEK